MPTFLPTRGAMLASAVAATPRHGFQMGTTGMGPPYGQAAINYYVTELRSQGFTMNRTYISWVSVNPSSGVYDWTNPDMWYTAMVAAGITPIMQHIFAPNHWFTGVGTNWNHSNLPYADFPPYPGTDWDNFIAANVTAATLAAQRYPLAIIEPQNEWNVAGIYCRPGGIVTACSAANYAAFHAPIQAAYKAVNPSQKVIVGGLLRMDSALTGIAGNTILASLKTALDALSCTPDGVSIHPYMLGATSSDPTIDKGPNAIGVTSWQSVGRCLDAMTAAGWGTIPVYITETGFRASQSNAQGAFNCNSEATKTLWNRYEMDSTALLYTKDARKPNTSWVEAFMYYRMEDYPSPTAPSQSAMYSGDPAGGPHTITLWGQSSQDFVSRYTRRLALPRLDGWTLTCPSAAVIGQSAATISATGVGTGAIPHFRSTDSSVVTVTTPTTGASSTTIQFVGAGTASIVVDSKNAAGAPVTTAQTIVVQGQIPTSSVVTPGSGWQVATSNSGTIQFTVAVTDQIGNPIVSPVGTWSSSDPTNAPIDAATGILTAVGVSTGVVVTFTPTGFGSAAGTSTGNVVLNPVLQITNAPSQLINVGAVAITITDGASPVTGCTLIISDATKATATGQDLYGKGSSGTFTLSASHSGYTNASPITVTCTGGGILDDKDAIGQANGTTVTSYTDPYGIVWAEPTHPPTYATNAINSHNALSFNGTNQFLKAATTHPLLNGASVTYMALYQPLSATPSANEDLLDNRDTVNSEGFVLGRNASSPNVGASVLSYFTAVSTLKQLIDGTKMPVSQWYRDSMRLQSGKQDRMINGVVAGSIGSDAVYRNPQTAPPRPTKGGSVFGVAGNNANMLLALETIVSRAVSNAEWLQMDYYQQLYATAGGINPATLDHLTLLISSTTASFPGTAPTLTVQKWADAAETTPSTATVSLSYTSSTTATAIVNSTTGIITLVAAGTTDFTVTDSISGKSATTPTLTVSAISPVTAVSVLYTGPQITQDVSANNGLLLFTGNSYALSAQDQSGNPLTTGLNWTSTDATNAPIGLTSGVLTPNAGVGGGTITCTHVASGVTQTVPFSVLKTPPALVKQMGNPTSTTALMGQIFAGVGVDAGYHSGTPTPTGSTQLASLYQDGTGANHFSIETNPANAGHYFMGKAGMVKTLGPTDSATGFLATFPGPSLAPASFTRAWGLSLIRFDPGFTPAGQGGGALAFKWGNWFNIGNSGQGRVGSEMTSGNPAGTSGDIVNNSVCSSPAGGLNATHVGNLTTEYTAGETWVNVVLYESRGGNILSSRLAWFKLGTVPSTPMNGNVIEGPMSGGAARTGAPPKAFTYTPTTVNFNQSPVIATQSVTMFDWQLVDGDTYGDPYGILASTGLATPTLTGISGGTVAHGTSSASIVLTGTNFNPNCQPVFSNAKIYPQSITINSSTQMTVVVAVDSTATTGAGTVLVNNQASQSNSSTQPVTVT